ncbi:MAG: plastocyanin/azurin family copper-binding protein [Cyclobacteriaceae bacterium]
MLSVFKIKFIVSAAIAGIFLGSLLAFLPKSNIEMEFAQNDTDTTTITLNAVAGLQYDLVRFSVKPGAKVKVVLTNMDDMSHNLLFTKPGKREYVVNEALQLEEKGPSMDYIPDSPEVLWSIPVTSPGEVKTLTFTAPGATGVYPYVCTFPGHGFSMYGAMYVNTDGKMPELEKDENIPLSRRGGDKHDQAHASHPQQSQRAHPYELTPPYLYRAYMNDASPASIAVNLPHDLSYCWDTETCELRYAWQGAFVDNAGLWKGKPNSEAKVFGTIFYRNGVRQPLRIGKAETISIVGYKGYRLINRYPEFHYTLDGVDVYEIIHPTEAGDGLIRTFSIPEGKKDLWFQVDARDGMKYESSAGQWQNNRLMIPASDVKKFSIVMIKKRGK